MRSQLLLGIVAMFTVATTSFSQDDICDTTYTPKYSKFFKIPVTFYDYHVDGSNPDFGFRVTSRWDQSGQSYANISGWVDSLLSADTKSPVRNPALKDTFFDISWNINKLFTPWVVGKVDSFTVKFPDSIWSTIVDTEIIKLDTTYDEDYNPVTRLDTITTVTVWDTLPLPDSVIFSDTMFKNMVIEDSIAAFWRPNEETYDNDTDSVWVFGMKSKMDPINGKGFGNESDSTQNAGYTFRLHNQFTYTGGEQLFFGGDDDLYLYINGKLALECGGFHEAIPLTLPLDSFKLADGSPLVVNQKYDIDIFFVERRMGGNFYIGGLSEFTFKGGIQIDTMYDTLIDCRPGVIYPRPGTAAQGRTLLGVKIPLSAQSADVEYFSIAGKKIAERKMLLAQTATPVCLPQGIYMVRVRFFDTIGRQLSKPSFNKMVVRQ